jgi:murein DD-endopeptidase MepM/ murein hydrolase activator NlpD
MIFRTLAPLLSILAMAGAFLGYRATRPLPAAPPPVMAATQHANAREAWAMDLLGRLGNVQPTGETVAFLEAWHRAEGGTATFNWLNTTQPAPGATDYNSVGVKNYPDYQTGIDATARTLVNGFYPRTLAGLVSNQPIVDDAEMGTWGTGGGAVRAQLAIVPEIVSQVPSRACPVSPCWLSGRGYGPGHPGIDLGANLGQPVSATMGGTAALSTTWPCGNGVMVTQGDTQTLMCHLSGFAVADGAAVQAGDVVGYAGESGQAFGVHVHYEIRIGGVNVDPSEVLR